MTETSTTPRPTKTFFSAITRRAVLEAFKRLQPLRDGHSQVVRFSVGARIEHLVVMTAFVVLAVTGLAQAFDTNRIAQTILLMLGGLEGTQQIHHFFALILMATAIYHMAVVGDGILVRLQPASMLPGKNDFIHFFQMITFNLGITKKLPLYDRYTFDEKLVYWVTVIAVLLLSLTGLVMWFPSIATQILPGSVYVYSIAIHRWQALFAIVVMLLLHIYQVLVRKQNFSIFNGHMSVAEMQADHPVELAYLQKAASLVETKNLPKFLKFSIEEKIVNRPPRAPKVKAPVETLEESNPAEEIPAEAERLDTTEQLVTNIPPSGEAL